jgi:hypothetical protein
MIDEGGGGGALKMMGAPRAVHCFSASLPYLEPGGRVGGHHAAEVGLQGLHQGLYWLRA